MEVKQTHQMVLGVNYALNVLQPRRQGELAESPYDIGINKVSHALTKTYQKVKPIIDPIAEREDQYQKKRQVIRKEILEATAGSPERAAAEAKEKELVDEFNKWQTEMLEEEVTVAFHQVDLEHWKRSCKTPPFWVLEALDPMWLNSKAPKDPFKITRGDAYKFIKAVREWLKAVPAHHLPLAQYQEAIAREEEKLRKKDLSPEDRAESKDLKKRLEVELEELRERVFPVDIGIGLALDLYWGFRSCRDALKDYESQRDEMLKRVEAWRKSEESTGVEVDQAAGAADSDEVAEPDSAPEETAEVDEAEPIEPLSEDDFKAWQDKQLDEVIDVVGIKQLSYSDIPETVGTPNGIVMDGLLAVLKED